MIIRRYQQGDENALWIIYHDTTHKINGRDYTPDQCERWAPGKPDMQGWTKRMQEILPFVAVDDQGIIQGFAELLPDGEIGFFYCHHERLCQGIGRLLYSALEAEARKLGLNELYADVSVSAKQFFICCGFVVVKEQHNMVCNSPAPNFVMKRKCRRHQ